MLHKIIISLGSNEGDRLQNLQDAVNQIQYHVGKVLKISKIYRTEAWGFNSAYFLNSCLTIESSKKPQNLLFALKEIEHIMGRKAKKSEAYEARPIDLDIIFYDNAIIREPNLVIPHKLLAARNFVLYPLADIAKDYVHPTLNKSVQELLEMCTDTGEINTITEQLVLPN